MEAGLQVLPASLSLYLLLGPPGWQYPAPHPELSSPDIGLGFPPLVPLAPILFSHFGYAISWSSPTLLVSSFSCFPSLSLLTWAMFTLDSPSVSAFACAFPLIYSKYSPPPHLGSVIPFLFYIHSDSISLPPPHFRKTSHGSSLWPASFPGFPLLDYAFFMMPGNSTTEPHIVNSDN